jgi:hypothetical protein
MAKKKEINSIQKDICTKYASTLAHSKKKEYFVVINGENMEIYNYLTTAETYNKDAEIYIIKNVSRNGMIKNVDTDIVCELCIKNNK